MSNFKNLVEIELPGPMKCLSGYWMKHCVLFLIYIVLLATPHTEMPYIWVKRAMYMYNQTMEEML